MSDEQTRFRRRGFFLRHFSLITAFGIPHGVYPEQKRRDFSLPPRMTGHCRGGVPTAGLYFPIDPAAAPLNAKKGEQAVAVLSPAPDGLKKPAVGDTAATARPQTHC